MKRIIPFAIVAVLIAASVAISLSVGGAESEAQRSTAVVDPAVWEALEEQAEIEVYISLTKLDTPLDEQTTEVRRAHAAAVQARVLRSLTAADISSVRNLRLAPAISATITASGLEKLAAHPDVEAVLIPGFGERGG